SLRYTIVSKLDIQSRHKPVFPQANELASVLLTFFKARCETNAVSPLLQNSPLKEDLTKPTHEDFYDCSGGNNRPSHLSVWGAVIFWMRLARRPTADRMAADQKLDRRRVYLRAGGLRSCAFIGSQTIFFLRSVSARALAMYSLAILRITWARVQPV